MTTGLLTRRGEADGKIEWAFPSFSAAIDD